MDPAKAGPACAAAGRDGNYGLAAERLGRTHPQNADENRTVVFVDESGFYLLPFVTRTYAPRGQTPVLPAPVRRDHLSGISGVTPDGRLFTHIQEHSCTGESIVSFLRQLLRQIPGKLTVVWDGAMIHRCQTVKEFLAAGAAQRLHLVRLPAYAPELNPDEGVWNLLKRRELANHCCRDRQELWDELRWAIRRLQRRPQLLRGCIRQVGYV